MLLSPEDLETVILGIVSKRGPCTPYAVRKEFEQSPSRHFSSSPGSVYPIIRRLEDRGWLRSEAAKRGKQDRRLYSITPVGLRRLRRWLTPPLPDSAIGMSFDPLRTRLYFLAVLSPARRRKLLEHAAARVGQEIAAVREDLRRYEESEESGDAFSRLAAEGGVGELRSKLRWIRRIAEEIG